MSTALIAIGIVAGGIISGSVLQFARKRTVWRFLQLLGAALLGIVVFTHLAEMFHLFPTMRWGEPRSAGHYLDLISAALGLILLPFGYICAAISERKNSNGDTISV